MNEPRLTTDIAEIKGLVLVLSERQQRTDLLNEARMTRLESSVSEIKSDVAEVKIDISEINKRGGLDHDEITRLKSQMTIRSAGWAILSTVVSLAAAFMGVRPH